MGDLAAFLAARLDEDEAVADLAAREGGTWEQDDPIRFPGSISSLGGAVVYDEGSPDENQAPHIARHDPARALREVTAQRAILAAYTGTDGDSPRDRERGRWDALNMAVRALATVYSDHPDYDPAWGPS